MTDSIEYYLKLPYTIEVVRDEGEEGSGWFAKVIELPGCITQAESLEELEFMIQDAMRAWIETALEDGYSVPEPKPEEAYSGKFVVRVPRSLHKDLADTAEREGVSLNTLVNTALSRFVGSRLAIAESKAEYKTKKRDV